MFVVPRLHQLKHGHLCTKSSWASTIILIT